MASVEMKTHEFTRGLEEACRKLGVTARVTAVGTRGETPRTEIGMQFVADKASAIVKADSGKLYEISVEVVEQ